MISLLTHGDIPCIYPLLIIIFRNQKTVAITQEEWKRINDEKCKRYNNKTLV